MNRPYRQIVVDRKGDVYCVRLRHHRLDEPDILEMADELLRLINGEGCRKMVLSLGPGDVECLYSVFLAKLVMVRRTLVEHGGQLKISDARPETIGVFEACHLKEYFDFVPDQATALAGLGSTAE
jgi:anti-anti-sigma factor